MPAADNAGVQRRALGRDAKLSRRMAWTMLALVLVYGGVLAYLTVWAVLWAWYGAPAFGLLVFIPVALVLAAIGPYRTALRLVGAEVVGPDEEPEVHATLDRLCALAEATNPRLAVSPEEVPEAFALGVSPGRSVIVVTRGLLARLEPKEVEAVLAHELSHIVNRDGAVMTVASFPLFAGSWLVRKGREKPVTLLLLFLVFPYVLAASRPVSRLPGADAEPRGLPRALGRPRRGHSHRRTREPRERAAEAHRSGRPHPEGGPSPGRAPQCALHRRGRPRPASASAGAGASCRARRDRA